MVSSNINHIYVKHYSFAASLDVQVTSRPIHTSKQSEKLYENWKQMLMLTAAWYRCHLSAMQLYFVLCI